MGRQRRRLAVGIPRSAARALSVAIALAAFAACGGAGTGPGASAASTSSASAPPDFELETLSGDTVRLSDHLGKDVVLVDFWATFCEPCLASMPHLNVLYEKYKSRGFVVLGVSVDGPDSIAQVRTEARKLGITFPILLDRETRVVGLYNPKTSAPYSVLIGRDGRIRARREGYTTASADALEADIVAALGK
jgi:peroxiredoxin